MNQLMNKEDMEKMLAGENAVLFMFVDWSAYSRRGKEVFIHAEAKLFSKSLPGQLSWWIADISSSDTPLSSALHQWITSEEQRGKVRMFPNIGMGNGSVLWLKNGEVVRFHANAERLGADALVQHTEQILTES